MVSLKYIVLLLFVLCADESIKLNKNKKIVLHVLMKI